MSSLNIKDSEGNWIYNKEVFDYLTKKYEQNKAEIEFLQKHLKGLITWPFGLPAPTPQELAQQLADILGWGVMVLQDEVGQWYFQGLEYEDRVQVADEDDCWLFIDDALSINTPVNYTGRWQDSKVTAEPRVKP